MANFDIWSTMDMLTNSVLGKYMLAILVLLIGYLVAKFIAWLFRSVLWKFKFLDTFFRVIDLSISPKKVIHIASVILFYLILLSVFVVAADILGIEALTSALQWIQSKYVPWLLAAWSAFIVAWVVATLAKLWITKWSEVLNLDEKISKEVSDSWSKESISVSQTLANAAYWFIFLFFLPSILDPLGFKELLNPIYEVNSTIVWYLPKILAASITFIIGLFIAKIIRKIITNLLEWFGADTFGKKIGLEGAGLSKIAGSLAYVVVLFPVIIQALDALEVEAISWPAKAMLATILSALPNLLFAIIIISVSFAVAKLVSGIVSELLSNLGFNSILKKIGINLDAKTKPAQVVGGLVFTFIMLFAAIEAANTMWFTIVGDIAKQFVEFAGRVLTWVVVFGIWAYIAWVVGDLVKATTKSKLLRKVAKWAVLTLAIAMWLKEMWIGDDIINLAFWLTLGSIAVAAALAFWLWSRDIAAKHLDSWLKNVK